MLSFLLHLLFTILYFLSSTSATSLQVYLGVLNANVIEEDTRKPYSVLEIINHPGK